MRDPYTVLGIKKSSSADEIKKSYRDLAKKYHPDRNQGDKSAEHKLKEINAAYNFLNDAEKRRRFDAGEIDANGQETFSSYQQAYNYGANPSSRRGGASHFFDENDFVSEDIINELFGARKRRSNPSYGFESSGFSSRTQTNTTTTRDINYTLSIPFIEAALGSKRTIKLGENEEVAITIPVGTESNTKLRLKGKGQKARFGNAAGDAYILLHVEPHTFFTKEGRDIRCEVPISLTEAVIGGSIRVPTLSGSVEMKVPAGTQDGAMLRLKGKGIPASTTSAAGDQYVRLKITIPDTKDEELALFLKKWKAGLAFNPRKNAGLE